MCDYVSFPQEAYYSNSYVLPTSNPNQWTISGHSRAMERTGFLLSGQGVKIMLDAGVDMPNIFTPIDAIFVTHAHIDHINALPMLMRHTNPGKPTHVFTPAACMHRIRQFTQLSFAIKIDADSELPEKYCSPCEPAVYPRDGQPVCEDWESDVRSWHPVTGGLTIPLVFDKGVKQPFTVHTVELTHARCSAIGYLISEARAKIRPNLYSKDKKIARENVMAARARGESVTTQVDCPIVAFVCDTSVAALTEGVGPQAARILQVPILMLECSYLGAEMEAEATRRGHVAWSALFPLVKDKLLANRARKVAAAAAFTDAVSCSADIESETTTATTTTDTISGELMPYFTLILIHFSLRYTDKDIIDFFLSESGFESVVARPKDSNTTGNVTACVHAKQSPPADIVLWLDSGIVQLDVA